MTEYRDLYEEISAAGAELAMLSVSDVASSARLKEHLQLPGVLLCDTEREVIRSWDVYNPRERDGIARPSVFVLDLERRVLAYSVYTMTNRVPAEDIVRFLRRKDHPLALKNIRLTVKSYIRYFLTQRAIRRLDDV